MALSASLSILLTSLAGSGCWARIPASKRGPGALFKAAACFSNGRVFVFGGMQNQRHYRGLHVLGEPAYMPQLPLATNKVYKQFEN